MSDTHVSNVPEQGQIVTVRQRRYVVIDVLPSTLSPSPLASRDRFADPQPRMFPVAVTFLVPERLD